MNRRIPRIPRDFLGRSHLYKTACLVPGHVTSTDSDYLLYFVSGRLSPSNGGEARVTVVHHSPQPKSLTRGICQESRFPSTTLEKFSPLNFFGGKGWEGPVQVAHGSDVVNDRFEVGVAVGLGARLHLNWRSQLYTE